jgi:phosphatidylethanolamine-binding protein
MSGLWNEETELYKVLKVEGIENLLWAGVNTDQCVLGSLVDAYNAGWGCVVVDDCCGTKTLGGREVSLGNVAVSFPSFLEWEWA